MLVEDEATPIPCVFWIHGDVCWGKLLAISFVNELMKKKVRPICCFAISRVDLRS